MTPETVAQIAAEKPACRCHAVECQCDRRGGRWSRHLQPSHPPGPWRTSLGSHHQEVHTPRPRCLRCRSGRPETRPVSPWPGRRLEGPLGQAGRPPSAADSAVREHHHEAPKSVPPHNQNGRWIQQVGGDVNPETVPSWGGWCRLQESNPRHRDYKSRALPSELNRHTVLKPVFVARLN